MTRPKVTDETATEIRKRIRSAEHLIDVKKRQIPKLKEKLMWALYAQCDEAVQKRIMQIWNSLKEKGRTDPKERDQLIALIERTLAKIAEENKTLE